MPQGYPPTVQLAKGVRLHKGTIEAQISFNGKKSMKCFKKDTPLAKVLLWQKQTIDDLAYAMFDSQKSVRDFPLSIDGWCYLYIVRVGPLVKIGRAADLRDRVKSLQVAQADKVVLIGATPIHASLEPLIHHRLKAARVRGEWYEMSEDVIALIDIVRGNRNPVQFVWPVRQPVIDYAELSAPGTPQDTPYVPPNSP